MQATPHAARSWWRSASAAGLVSIAAQVCATDSAAPAVAAMPPPYEVAAAVAGARLQGRGTQRFFGLPVYEARLWVTSDFEPRRYEAHAFALELEYARKLGGAVIAQRSIAEMRRAGGLDDGRAQAWQAAMAHAFPDVVPGDRLTGVRLPGVATRFFHNGRPTSAVEDPAFARLFFGIWLAATTSEPGLRRQLIGPGS